MAFENKSVYSDLTTIELNYSNVSMLFQLGRAQLNARVTFNRGQGQNDRATKETVLNRSAACNAVRLSCFAIIPSNGGEV